MAMAVTRFRLGELTEVALKDLDVPIRDLQPHRVRLRDLHWLKISEAQFPLGRKVTVVPRTLVTPARGD